MPIDYNALTAPFPPDEIDWRVGSTTKDKSKGMALAYIDARVVMDRLDEVCGPEGWQCRYPHAHDKTCCEIGIRVLIEAADENIEASYDTYQWVWKADGAGDTDFEASKGAFSDAFKRAAVRWGIGRYLYEIASPWVAIEPRGKSYAIVKNEIPKLNACLPNTAAPIPPKAEPEGMQGKVELQNNLKDFAEQLGAVETQPQLDGLLLTFHSTIEEAKVDMPSWWETGDGLPEQFVPLKDRIASVEERLAIQGA